MRMVFKDWEAGWGRRVAGCPWWIGGTGNGRATEIDGSQPGRYPRGRWTILCLRAGQTTSAVVSGSHLADL